MFSIPKDVQASLLETFAPKTFYACILDSDDREVTRRIKCSVIAHAVGGGIEVDVQPHLEFNLTDESTKPGPLRVAFFASVFGGVWLFTEKVGDLFEAETATIDTTPDDPRVSQIVKLITDEFKKQDEDDHIYTQDRTAPGKLERRDVTWLIDGDVNISALARAVHKGLEAVEPKGFPMAARAVLAGAVGGQPSWVGQWSLEGGNSGWTTVENFAGNPIAYASELAAIQGANFARLNHMLRVKQQ